MIWQPKRSISRKQPVLVASFQHPGAAVAPHQVQVVQQATAPVIPAKAQKTLHRSFTLRELQPQFVRLTEPAGHHLYVDSLAEAQGVLFLCPLCFQENGGEVGTHSVLCWSASRGVPDDVNPKPGRWKLDGTGYDDLTLNADPPKSNSRSVLLLGGCAWHGFVTNGVVT